MPAPQSTTLTLPRAARCCWFYRCPADAAGCQRGPLLGCLKHTHTHTEYLNTTPQHTQTSQHIQAPQHTVNTSTHSQHLNTHTSTSTHSQHLNTQSTPQHTVNTSTHSQHLNNAGYLPPSPKHTHHFYELFGVVTEKTLCIAGVNMPKNKTFD